MPDDIDVAEILRKTDKPVILAVNKSDNRKLEQEGVEFYSLGLGEVVPISSIQGTGVADLLDKVVESFPSSESQAVFPDESIRCV